MAFALLIIGVVLLTAGVRDSQSDLYKLVHGDFTGDVNFFYWFISILLIGAIGYIPKLRPISTAFLVLLVLVLFLSKGSAGGGNFFQTFTTALGTTQTAGNASVPSSTPSIQTLQTSANQQLQTIQQQLSQNLAQSAAALSQDISQ
jgi:hypothetical protein